MPNTRSLNVIQHYIAVVSIGPSTLRNQGASGVIDAAREFLTHLHLSLFSVRTEAKFLSILDSQTKRLKSQLPAGARKWGTARKAMNIFLRNACYNRFLCSQYNLAGLEDWMEMPLDALVAQALRRKDKHRQLPLWPGLGELDKETSGQFQAFAKQLAASHGISRLRLEMEFWTEGRNNDDQTASPNPRPSNSRRVG